MIEVRRLRLRNVLAIAAMIPLLSFIASCDRPDAEKLRERLHLPQKDFVPDSKVGEETFVLNCARCHGRYAGGTSQGPPLVHKTYESIHHPDVSFRLAVRDGVRQRHWHLGDMPAIPDLSPEDVGHIITYVRVQQRKAGVQ